ncbi:MAG: TM2 domain-containing protein [Bacteroidetes bacterium]|nr:TM2 domain-containing protein [Bacteroidota bacterium]
MSRILQYLPELTGNEQLYVAQLFQGMSDAEVAQFTTAYRVRRRDPQTVLLLALLGFFGAAGVHRLWLGDIGMGIVYLITAGFCFIGTIVDLLNYRGLADRYNLQIAQETAALVRGLPGAPFSPQLGA